jgi:hypothetical protein
MLVSTGEIAEQERQLNRLTTFQIQGPYLEAIKSKIKRDITREEFKTIRRHVDNIEEKRFEREKLYRFRQRWSRDNRLWLSQSMIKIQRHTGASVSCSIGITPTKIRGTKKSNRLAFYISKQESLNYDPWIILGERRPRGFIPLFVESILSHCFLIRGVWLSEPRWLRNGYVYIGKTGKMEEGMDNLLLESEVAIPTGAICIYQKEGDSNGQDLA